MNKDSIIAAMLAGGSGSGGGGMPQDYPLSYSKIYEGTGTPQDETITIESKSLPEASGFEIVINSGTPIVCMAVGGGVYADTDDTTEIWENDGSVCVWSESFTDGSSAALTITAVNVNEQFKAGVTMVDSALPSNPIVRIYGDLYQMYNGTITIYDGSGAPTQYLSYAALAPIVEEENEGNGGEQNND